MIQAPLVMASAAVGFAHYTAYLIPLSDAQGKAVSAAVIILIVLLLYRKIETIGKISVLLWTGVIITMCWIIGGGVMQGNFAAPVKHINDGLTADTLFASSLGFATVKTMYSFLGYYNVCHLGGEIIKPEKNIPRSMFISIAAISVLYLLMNISVASVLPLPVIIQSKFVVSEFIETIAGATAAKIATALILWVAFASVFSATLGYSRIPYAAAKDGAFFKIFATLHPTKNFPYISLLALGAVALVFSIWFDIKQIIPAILAMRILTQFVAQAVGLLLLHRKKEKDFFKWKMPLFPLPVIIAIAMWLFIFYSTEWKMIAIALCVIASGIIVLFFIKEKSHR